MTEAYGVAAMLRIRLFRLVIGACLLTGTAVGAPVVRAQGGGPLDVLSHAFIYQSGVMTDLGTLPGKTSSEAHAINTQGQVVGTSGGRAFSWTAQTGMTDLNSLLPSSSTWVLESANDVNDSGQITGSMLVGGAFRGFLMTPGAGGGAPTTVDIGILPGSESSPDAYAEPLAINAAGDVVGRALGPNVNDPGGSLIAVPFLYSAGTLTNLGAFAGAPMSLASDINNHSVITGESDRALPPNFNVEHRAFRVTPPGALEDLGEGGASGINDLGQIVGVNGAGHAALFSGGSITDLGTLPGSPSSSANAINQTGMIVGTALTPDLHGERAVIFTGGTLTDIGALPGVFDQGAALDVNDAGQIVGISFHIFNTPLGDQVVGLFDPATGTVPATLSFTGVTQAGDSRLTISGTGPPPPSGFSLGSPPKYFDITTTAVFSQVVVCISDSSVTAGARLLHFTGGVGTDVTAPGSPDLTTTPPTLCSVPLTSLSPFAIATTSVAPDTSAPVTTATLTPATNPAGWNRAAVTVLLQAVDPDGAADVAHVTYSATGAQPIALTAAPGDHVSVGISNEGVTILSFFAQDLAGNTGATHSVTVRIDQTSPVVTYAGNAGTYTVDQAVAITCSAGDPANANGTPGSGLASTTCSDIAGPAYTFGVGSHSYSATAIDAAGNTGSGSATFDVQVTLGGLCLLTTQFVETSSTFLGLPPSRQASWNTALNLLCRLLAAAGATATPKQKAQLVAAYQSVLPSLVRSGLLTSAQAATLLGLSKAI